MKAIPQHTLDYIDSWLHLRYAWETHPGFVVAIAKDGKVVFNKAYGYADIASRAKMTPDHVFRIASHSKTFTATAIMQLQEKGLLRIDDPVVQYLPWLKKHSDKWWGEVTIRQLLSHSAGVIRDGEDSRYWQVERPFPKIASLREAILETPLCIEPNTRLKYSNYGYALLGEVVENASGVPYNDYVTAHIIDPLGLKNTYPEINDKILKKLPTGYSRETLKKERHVFPHISTESMSAATGFCATAADLCTYFTAQFQGSGKLLKDASKKEMQRSHWNFTGEKRSYGLGLNIDHVGSRNLIGHGGGFPGFVTKTVADPKDGIVVTVLANCHGAASTAINTAIYQLLDEFGDEPPKKELQSYEGRFGGLYGVMDIVAHAGGVRALYPNTWTPVSLVEKLSVVDEHTLKVEETRDSNNLGELIKFVRNSKGQIEHIIDGGAIRPVTTDGDIEKTWK